MSKHLQEDRASRFGFDVRGLPGYRVEESNIPGRWWAIACEGQVRTFSWNDLTQRHDIPVSAPKGGWVVAERRTAKAAAAAAYAYARWVQVEMAKTRVGEVA